MKKKLKVLALFDAIRPTTIDQDLSKEMKTEDWKTEANVLSALHTGGSAWRQRAYIASQSGGRGQSQSKKNRNQSHSTPPKA